MLIATGRREQRSTLICLPQPCMAYSRGRNKPTRPTAATWSSERNNANLCPVLFLATVVRGREGEKPEDGLGDGQAAVNALEETYDAVSNSTCQELCEELAKTKKSRRLPVWRQHETVFTIWSTFAQNGSRRFCCLDKPRTTKNAIWRGEMW